MARGMRTKSKSGYYHVMLRGNERRNIFLDDQDKLYFIETLFEKKRGDRFFLQAFCLMDNHVHLMLSEGQEDMGTFMKRINVKYVYYFNKKYKRVGHLFQDRFKSEVVEDNSYLLALARYIHQNPVKAGMVKHAGEYKWSSYSSYLNDKEAFGKILETETILGLFSESKEVAKKQYREYMDEEINDTFTDINEEAEVMDEEAAKEIYKRMRELSNKPETVEESIKKFKERTNLSARAIARISGVNKDRVSKILRDRH